MTLEIDENELKGLFKMIDKDKSSYINYDELQKAIREALREYKSYWKSVQNNCIRQMQRDRGIKWFKGSQISSLE